MYCKNLVSLLTASFLLFASVNNSIACTLLMVMDTSGNAYKGRTMEYNLMVPSALTYYPAGTKVESLTPAGKRGLTFETKFPILGMAGDVVPKAQPYFAEAMNDQGLSFAALWFNGADMAPVKKDDANILSVNDLGSWVLGNFKNVSEVKAAITAGNIDFWLPVAPSLSPKPLPLHYGVMDKQGGSIVIEFADGKMNVYDNPTNAFTNDPSFPWHVQNLSNYTFTNVDKNTAQLGKLKFRSSGPGNAISSLPSAQTPEGRFVKAAFYANYVTKGKTPDAAINQLSHILNNFDIPTGLTIDYGSDGIGTAPITKAGASEITAWTVMNDLSRNLFYVRSINALNWSVIDLNKLKSGKSIKTMSAYDIDKAGANSYDAFYK